MRSGLITGMMCLLVATCVVGCRPGGKATGDSTRLQGAGASFPAPFYRRLVVAYQAEHPNVLIDYQSIGSGGGIKAITDQTVHFCASDAPMNEKELEAVGGEDAIIEFPSCAGGVVPVYNVPGLESTIKFTGPLLADIYLGKVNRWNDPALAKINPDLQLPDLAITPVWRTDGSGTSFILTNYLATQSEDFREQVGSGKAVQWPIGQGGKNNDGVTAIVEQTAGGIGYVEQSYADHNQLLYGEIRNKDGKFVKASAESVSAAGVGPAAKMQGHVLAANVWDQPGQKAYPIASFTYLIVYRDLKNLTGKESAQELLSFLWWTTHAGQKHAVELGYAPLANEVRTKVEKALRSVTYKGEKLKVGNPTE
jgi:phosphate transport system substrate-binding protein